MWELLAMAAPGVISGLSKMWSGGPDRQDYIPDTGYIDKYVGHLKGQQQDLNVYEQLMQPMLRTIGQQGGRQKRELGHMAARGGYQGSGLEGQLELSRQQGLLGAYTQAGEKAGMAQAAEDRKMGEQIRQATMEKERMLTQGQKQYEMAEKQHRQSIQSDFLGAAGNVLTGYISSKAAEAAAVKKGAATAAATAQDSFGTSLAKGFFKGTLEQFLQGAESAGLSPEHYALKLETDATNQEVIDEKNKEVKDAFSTYASKGGALDEVKFIENYNNQTKMNVKDFGTYILGQEEAELPIKRTRGEVTNVEGYVDNYGKDVGKVNKILGTNYKSWDEVIKSPKEGGVYFPELLYKTKHREKLKKSSQSASVLKKRIGVWLDKTQFPEVVEGFEEAEVKNLQNLLLKAEKEGSLTVTDKQQLKTFLYKAVSNMKKSAKEGRGVLVLPSADFAEKLGMTRDEISQGITQKAMRDKIDKWVGDIFESDRSVDVGTSGSSKIPKKVGTGTGSSFKTVPGENIFQTYLPGYYGPNSYVLDFEDENKGWKMEIPGETTTRVFTKPDGTTVMTDLDGNILESSSSFITLDNKRIYLVPGGHTLETDLEGNPTDFSQRYYARGPSEDPWEMTWDFKVVGNTRVYTMPDGSEFVTDLEGNPI